MKLLHIFLLILLLTSLEILTVSTDKSSSIDAVKLTDEDVEAWYWKLLNFSYNFAYVNPGSPFNTYVFALPPADLCVHAYSGYILSSEYANEKFVIAFEIAIDQVTAELNTTLYDDLIVAAGGAIYLPTYVRTIFREKLEANLAFIFQGSSTASSAPCPGIPGTYPDYQINRL